MHMLNGGSQTVLTSDTDRRPLAYLRRRFGQMIARFRGESQHISSV